MTGEDMPSAQADHGYELTAQGNYLRMETWGPLHEEDLDAPAKAALALRKESGINRLLDNIQRVDERHVSIPMQTKGVGVIWSLREFEKVAIVFNSGDLGKMFLATLEAMHLNLNNKFKGFDNETEAITWLQEE
jgi:hypothetical protein